MKKLAIIILLGGMLPLHGESLLSQLKKGLQEAQKLAKQVADQKRDLDRCRKEKNAIEAREKKNVQAKDEAYKTITSLNRALEVQIKELQAQLKKARTSTPKVPPAAPPVTPAVRKQPVRTGPPPIPAGALTTKVPPAAPPLTRRVSIPTVPPAAAPPVQASKQPSVPTQPGRQKFLESIRTGTKLKPVGARTRRPVRKPGAPLTIQEQLEEQLRIRRGSISEDDEDNSDWDE